MKEIGLSSAASSYGEQQYKMKLWPMEPAVRMLVKTMSSTVQTIKLGTSSGRRLQQYVANQMIRIIT
jgi:hypothetical protein